MAVVRAKPVKVCARCHRANWKSSMIRSKTTGNYYCKSLKECDGAELERIDL